MYSCIHVLMYSCTHVLMYSCTHVLMYPCTYVPMYSCTHVLTCAVFWGRGPVACVCTHKQFGAGVVRELMVGVTVHLHAGHVIYGDVADV